MREHIGYANEINALLRRIDALRKRDSPPLGGYDFIHLNHHSFFVEPQVAIEKLTAIADTLEAAEGKFAKKAPRILLAGHAVAVGDYLVVKNLEDAGALIATEMMDEGLRWYRWDTAVDGDPLRNLWRAKYLDKVPVNIFQPAWRVRFDHMKPSSTTTASTAWSGTSWPTTRSTTWNAPSSPSGCASSRCRSSSWRPRTSTRGRRPAH